jgi:general secretion pathway protein J
VRGQNVLACVAPDFSRRTATLRTRRFAESRVPRPASRHQHGFTLFEVLGAMALLALLLLGVYSGVRSATHTVQAGTIKIEQLDEVRSAQQFLRRELAQAMAQSMGMDANGNGIFFVGTADSMRFVAPLPGYLGRMGPQLIEVKLVKGEHGKQLVASLAVLPPNGDKPKPLGDPQVLLDGVIDGSFSYRGVNQQGQPLDWQNDWNTAAAMPNLVVIKLALGQDRPWPMLSVPLRVNAAALQGPGNLLRGLRGPGVGP